MSYVPADINPKEISWRLCHSWRGGIIVCCLLLLAPVLLHAQGERWDFRQGITGSDEVFNPNIAIDKWGNVHTIGTSTAASGLYQIFYSADVSGRFHAPVQATDTGDVYTDLNGPLNPSVLRLDPSGIIHIAFITRMPGATAEWGLFHASNGGSTRDFRATRLLTGTSQTQYDMAVDSLGIAHVVWVDRRDPSITKFQYWTSQRPLERKEIASVQCLSTPGQCRIGTPDIEIGRDGLVVVFRADSGSVYMFRQTSGGFSPVTKVTGTPSYDHDLTLAGAADLRLRMAADLSGTIHLLYPHFAAGTGHRIMQTSNVTGQWVTWELNTASFDTAASAFDIAYNGSDRVVAMWTVLPLAGRTGVPRVGFGEIIQPGLPGNTWRVTADLNSSVTSGGAVWKEGLHITATGDRVTIVSAHRTSPDANQQVGLIIRSSTHPAISYLLPDAAAPGMNVVVEALAPASGRGGFGPDGFRRSAVVMEAVNAEDAERVVFGPSIVSWEGRLVSTMVFIAPGAAPGPVPVRIRITDENRNVTSNVDTLFIVQPVPNPGRLNNGGAIGSAALGLGRRSKRGVLVVDSLILGKGIFTIDTTDTDPVTPGNQGFLPVTILSRGRILIDTAATLTVSATHDSARMIYGNGGPGGGGGGTGGFYAGGSGFTGGGPIVNTTSAGVTSGSGSVRSSRWGGGGTLNGTPGGTSYPGSPGGGGTGHPFGASGSFGRVAEHVPVRPNSGGYGGGSGGVNPIGPNPNPFGGGGGGHALRGEDGKPRPSDDLNNGGEVVGTHVLVPLAGGSGGGGGGFSSASSAFSNGGGGGGALALFAYDTLELNGSITADGAEGINPFRLPSSSGGGGGAGGGILVGAQGMIKVGSTAKLSAKGAAGGQGSNGTNGGTGLGGRIRHDGKLSSPFIISSPAPAFQGPATRTNASLVAGEGAKITGFGAANSQMMVYIRAKGGSWNYSNPYETTVGSDGSWSLELGPDGAADELYVVAMQRVASLLREEYRFTPEWVMSSAGANIISRPVLDLGIDSINFACINFDSCTTFSINVSNRSGVADLIINAGATQGPFTVMPPSVRIGANRTERIQVRFCPGGVGSFQSQLQLRTNIPTADSVRTIDLRGCGISGRLKVRDLTINLGEICPNECKDQVIRISNPGEGVLTITEIEGRPEEIGVTIKPGVSLPIILKGGESIDVPVQLCLKRIDQRGVQVHLRANSFYPLDVILVKGTNIGPEFEMPDGINLGEVLVPVPGVPTCRGELWYIWNRSTKDRLKVRIVSLSGGDGKFTLEPALPLDTTIAPGEPLPLKVWFCVDGAGEYRAQLRILFGGGSCEVDTVLQLWGAGVLPAPRFVITEPKRDPLDDCRTIRFPVTSLTKSRSNWIVIQNGGTASGKLGRVQVIGDDADFFTDLAANTEVEPSIRIQRSIRFTPKAIGFRSAKLIFTYEDGRPFDTICVEGEGAEPGVRFCEVDSIDFGDVRVGRTVTLMFCLFNDGTAADTLLSMSNFAFPPFASERMRLDDGRESPLPIIIVPGNERVFVPFSFTPTAEGERVQVPSIRLASGRDIFLPLRGRGVVEHITTSTGMIDFGCLPGGTDTTQCFTVSNPGSYPLRIDTIWVQAGRGRFTIDPMPDLPVILPVGGSVEYCVRYVSGGGKVEDGQVVIENSATQRTFVGLRGETCGTQQEIELWIPDTSAMVGDIFYLPIHAKLNMPAALDNISYSIKLTYAADLLLPLDSPKVKARPLDFSSTISTDSGYFDEQPNGELLVVGSIRRGEQEGVLVKIPFKVLLAPHYTTPIAFKEVTILVNVITTTSTFTALDCDTTSGGVILLGPYALSQNRPNPFNPSTVIPYSIGKTAHVRLNLYDAMGTLARVLVDEVQPAGDHLFTLDASTLPSGIYTYELISGRFRKTMRLVLLE